MFFSHALGRRKGKEYFQDLEFNDENKKKLQSYYDGFEQYVKPRSNIIYSRHKFQSRMQNQDETFEQFVTELQLLVKDCGYDKKDEMVRDRIVTGEKKLKIREKLLNVGSDLTFAKTLDIARAYEVSHTQCSATEDKTVNSVKSKKTKSSCDSRKHEYRTGTEKQQISCGKCGYDHVK